MSAPVFTDRELRAYFAAIISTARFAFGDRSQAVFGGGAGEFKSLAQNSTTDRVISVIVSRADLMGPPVQAIFTKNPGGASPNDFSVLFGGTASFRFVLNPGERIGLQTAVVFVGGPAVVVVAQETY